MAPTSPPGHLRYRTLVSLGSNLGGMVDVLMSDEPGFGMTEVSCTFPCSKPEAKKGNTKFSMVVSSRGEGGCNHGEAHGRFPG